MPQTADSFARRSNRLFEAFEQTAQRYPGQIAFKADGGAGKQYTYVVVSEMVKGLARGLMGGDFSHVGQIGLLSENRPEWCLSYLAITAAGKTVVPIDANVRPSEIEYVVNHAGLAVVFTSAKFEPMLSERFPALKLFCFDDASPDNWLNLFGNASEYRPPDRPDEVAVLIYTSGTTGSPKAVQLTHRNLLANIEGIRPALSFGPDDTFLSVLPLHHTFEATCGFLVPLTSGSTVVYARSFKSSQIKEDIAANRATIMCGVPLLFEKMYHSIKRKIESAPLARRAIFKILYWLSGAGWSLNQRWGRALFRGLREKGGFGSVRMFVSGGAAVPPYINRFFNLIGFDFLQGYGMTECSPVISVNRPDDNRFASVGPPLENLDISIHDPDEHGVGEILIKGDSITPGYKNEPEKTAELIKDGWLYTGDLGMLKHGHLWITGRKKNLIVSSAGKNIYPEQIEEYLLTSKYILETVVFGRKKEGKQGEEVCAIIVPDIEQFKTDHGIKLDSPDTVLIENIILGEVATINRDMADYKRVGNIKVQLEELEKTSSKKVKRFVYK